MSVRRAELAPLVLVSLLFAALGGGLGEAWAQQPAVPAATGPTNLTIMVVDVQSLLQNSKSAKMVRQQIEGKRNEYAKEISQQEETLRQERDALQRQQSSLSADALNQKGREFQAKVNELDRNVQSKRQALERSNAEALEKIQEVMLKIIKANLVFQRSELVLFDQGFDVTDEVLHKLDDQLPTLTVNFVAPVASNSGQPAAQPAAAPAQPAPKKKK